MSPAVVNAAPLFVPLQLLPAVSVAGVLTPAGVDMLDYDGLVHVVQSCGVATAMATFVGRIQSSPDNSVWTDVTNAVFANVTTSNNVQALVLDLNMCQRFIRWTNTFSGTSIVAGVTVSGIKKIR